MVFWRDATCLTVKSGLLRTCRAEKKNADVGIAQTKKEKSASFPVPMSGEKCKKAPAVSLRSGGAESANEVVLVRAALAS